MKIFKRYTLVVVAFPILLLSGMGGMFFAPADVFPPDVSWSLMALDAKTSMAKGIPAKKALIIGGSNVHWGIRVKQFTQATGFPAVNFGIHGGITAHYMFWEARKVLNPGDVAILSFEYETFSEGRINSPTTALSVYRNPIDAIVYFFGLSSSNKRELIKSFTPAYTISGLQRWLGFGAGNVADQDYFLSHLNDRGDGVGFYRDEKKVHSLQSKLDSLPPLMPFDEKAASTEDIHQFIQWCRAHGIEVYFTWPNTIDHRRYSDQNFSNLTKNINEFFTKRDVEIIGTPQDAQLPISLMYDTEYHPNYEGAQIRTNKFIKSYCLVTHNC